MKLSVLAGMRDFRCLGGECPDTCCSGLRVPVTPAWLARTGSLLGDAKIDAVTERDGDAAFLKMGADGLCPLLAPDRLCSLHRDHGPGALPSICDTFPRVTHAAGDRLERSGSLGCPEVARRVLAERGGAELTDAGDSDEALAAAPISVEDLELRAVLLAIARTDALSPAAALAAMLRFASAAAERPPEDRRELLDAFSDPTLLAALPFEPLPKDAPLALISKLLRAREVAHLAPALRRAAESYDLDRLGPDALAAREAKLIPAPIADVTRNALLHHLVRKPHGGAPTLPSYVLELCLRVALARALFLSTDRAFGGEAALRDSLADSFRISARYLEPSPPVRDFLGHVSARPARDQLGFGLLFASL